MSHSNISAFVNEHLKRCLLEKKASMAEALQAACPQEIMDNEIIETPAIVIVEMTRTLRRKR